MPIWVGEVDGPPNWGPIDDLWWGGSHQLNPHQTRCTEVGVTVWLLREGCEFVWCVTWSTQGCSECHCYQPILYRWALRESITRFCGVCVLVVPGSWLYHPDPTLYGVGDNITVAFHLGGETQTIYIRACTIHLPSGFLEFQFHRCT